MDHEGDQQLDAAGGGDGGLVAVMRHVAHTHAQVAQRADDAQNDVLLVGTEQSHQRVQAVGRGDLSLLVQRSLHTDKGRGGGDVPVAVAR